MSGCTRFHYSRVYYLCSSWPVFFTNYSGKQAGKRIVMNKSLLASARPLTIVFVLFTAIFLLSADWLVKKNVDIQVLLGGNLLLFIVSMFSYFLSNRALRSSNPQAF